MKRILAICGVVILVGLYVSTLVLALLQNKHTSELLMISIGATIIIPVFIYIYSRMFLLMRGERENIDKLIHFDNEANLNIPNDDNSNIVSEEELEEEALDTKE